MTLERYTDPIKKSTYIHLFLLKLEKNEPEVFEKIGAKRCSDCNATGLDYEELDGLVHWDGHSYCHKCKAIGYLFDMDRLEEETSQFLCHVCQGAGCFQCDRGFTDWISHITRG